MRLDCPMLTSPRCAHALFAALISIAPACGDDEEPAVGTDDSGGDPSTGADTGATGGNGTLGPTAQVRVVNLVDGVTFTAWGADTDFNPVIVHDELAFETVSDYFHAPLNEFAMDPEIVLMPAGEAPHDGSTWQIDNSSGPDRAFVSFGQLDAADEQATIIVSLDDITGNVQWEQLDESELVVADPGMVGLHISWNLFDLGGSVVPAFAVAGDPCLFDGSTSVTQSWSVAPGTFDVGIYDRQTISECTEQLASTSITAAAGDEVLVTVYHVGPEVRFLSAPIPQ